MACPVADPIRWLWASARVAQSTASAMLPSSRCTTLRLLTAPLPSVEPARWCSAIDWLMHSSARRGSPMSACTMPRFINDAPHAASQPARSANPAVAVRCSIAAGYMPRQ
jgi:hypothetical protein